MATQEQLVKLQKATEYVPASATVAEQDPSLARELFKKVPANPLNPYQAPFLNLSGANDQNTVAGARLLEQDYRQRMELLNAENLPEVYDGLLRKYASDEDAKKITDIFETLRGKKIAEIEKELAEAQVVLDNPQRYDPAKVQAAQVIKNGYKKFSEAKTKLYQFQLTSLVAPLQLEQIPKGLEKMANTA